MLSSTHARRDGACHRKAWWHARKVVVVVVIVVVVVVVVPAALTKNTQNGESFEIQIGELGRLCRKLLIFLALSHLR